MEDQQASPALDESEHKSEHEDEFEGEDTGPGARGGWLSAAALLGFAAVLVVFATVMTLLYVRERGARADADRMLAARTAELHAAQNQLHTSHIQLTVDPDGNRAIRTCVREGVEQEKLNEQFEQSYGAAGNPIVTNDGLSVVAIGSTACELAATYLK